MDATAPLWTGAAVDMPLWACRYEAATLLAGADEPEELDELDDPEFDDPEFDEPESDDPEFDDPEFEELDDADEESDEDDALAADAVLERLSVR